MKIVQKGKARTESVLTLFAPFDVISFRLATCPWGAFSVGAQAVEMTKTDKARRSVSLNCIF